MIEIGPPKRAEAVTALARALDDAGPDVRIVAAEAFLRLGETEKGAAMLVQALFGKDSHLNYWGTIDDSESRGPSPVRGFQTATFFMGFQWGYQTNGSKSPASSATAVWRRWESGFRRQRIAPAGESVSLWVSLRQESSR